MEHDRSRPTAKEATNTFEDDDDSSAKKKQQAKDVARFLAAKNIAKPDAINAPPKEERSIWQKLTGQTAEDEKREEAENSTEPDGKEQTDTDSEQLEADRPIDELTEAEEATAAATYVEERLHELADEELAAGEDTEALPVAHDRTVAFLASLRDRLAEVARGNITVDQAIETSYDEVVAAESQPAEPAPNDAPIELTHEATVPLATSGGGEAGPPPSRRRSASGGEEPRRRAQETILDPATSEARSAAAPVAGAAEGAFSLDESLSQYRERRAQLRGLLVGGVVGYLIGRRRGRIKTEKRLAKVQQKLEKRVAEVQQHVIQKETELQLVSQARRQEQYASKQAVAAVKAEGTAQLAKQAEQQAAARSNIGPTQAEQKPAWTAHAAAPNLARQTGAVAGNPNHARMEQVVPVSGAVAEMSYQELLNESANIRIGESNLKRVYDARLVDEKGLRRLVQEYRAGHDMRRVLAREFLIKELRFERDPHMKSAVAPDQARLNGTGAPQGQDPATSASAALPIGGSADTSAIPGSGKKSLSRSVDNQTTVSPAILALLTFLTIALALYAVWLTMTR